MMPSAAMMRTRTITTNSCGRYGLNNPTARQKVPGLIGPSTRGIDGPWKPPPRPGVPLDIISWRIP